MPVRFAINGLGRIGRTLVRVAAGRPALELVAVNDVLSPEVCAHLLRHDSIHGQGPEVAVAEQGLVLDGHAVLAFRESRPSEIPWERSGAEVVVECTGRFLERDGLAPHLRPGVRHVVVSANAEGVDLTVCLGVNDALLDPARQPILSNASCSTNCVAVVAAVLDRAFGLAAGLLTTVHSYTSDQNLTDSGHRDLRRARAAALNMIPTTTGAARAVGRVLPHLADRLAGQAVRVPVADVSLVDLVARLERRATPDTVRAVFRRAAREELPGILGVTDEELVSSDFLGSPCSAVVDLPLVQNAGEDLVRVVAWYDNEWGYASRLADLLSRLEVPR